MIEKNIEWGEIGYIVFKNIYARERYVGDTIKEEFADVIERELSSCKKQLNLFFTKEEELEYKNLRLGLKCSVAGRAMWQMGTNTVDKLGMASLQNCATIVIDNPVEPFTWAFDMLMLGCGVGFNIQRKYVNKLPIVRNNIKVSRLESNDADFIVPDSREGWVSLLKLVLESFFYGNNIKSLTYSTILIRKRGEKIRGFGGEASGSDILADGIDRICELLNSRVNSKLTPVDCLDLMCMIAYVVKSGNVRRSALISIGDYDDEEYLVCKRWDLITVPNWRNLVNISVECPDTKLLPKLFWDSYFGGESIGLVNIELAKKCGRIGDNQYTEDDIVGFNPCGEQPLSNGETCNLAEIYLCRCESYEEFERCLYFMYKVNKHILALPCHLYLTESAVHKKMRMGIGVTGILQSSEEQMSWLSRGYNWLREFDEQYSEKMGFNKSVKLTTVKPSGTLSLLAGVTHGAHPSPAGKYYIRRIRMSSDSDVLNVCKENGYEFEYVRNFDGTLDKNTTVVSFPCVIPDGTPIAANYSWKDQINLIMKLQREWSDNAVSCSVYYDKKDVDDIIQFMNENYKDNIKSISFMLKYEHGFDQAPYETITKERYDEMKNKCKPITQIKTNGTEHLNIVDCDNGACAIK